MDLWSFARRVLRPARIALVATGVWALAGSAAQAAGTSADRLIMWTECRDLPRLTDAELGAWKARGVDGFACHVRHLRGMGGTQDFTGNPGAPLAGAAYELQRSLRDSRVVERMHARGMKAYLGFYLVNYYNTRTPLGEWFDDQAWANSVLPKVGDLAAAAKALGFAGVAFDTELYGQSGGVKSATWDWNYPGNVHTEQQVRAKVRQRGQQLMSTLLSRFPGVEVAAYAVKFPQTWGELVQEKINGLRDIYVRRVDINFWDGLSGVRGYDALRLWDATFYKMPHLGTWDTAFEYEYNRLYSYLSRALSDWEYAAPRFHASPFAWIDAGTTNYERAREPAYVADQLSAFRKWGTGGEYANYAYGGLWGFDYAPYQAAMVAGSTPGTVDTQAPSLSVAAAEAAPKATDSIRLEGTSGDNLAVRVVRWASDRGHQGVARVSWSIKSGDPRSGYVGETSWEIPAIPLEPGDNKITVTAEDIKGLTRSSTVTLRRNGSLELDPSPPTAPTGTKPKEAEPKTAQPNQAKPNRRAIKRRLVAKRRRAARRRAAAHRRCVRAARARNSGAAQRAAVRRCAHRRCVRAARARKSGAAQRVAVRRCARRT